MPKEIFNSHALSLLDRRGPGSCKGMSSREMQASGQSLDDSERERQSPKKANCRSVFEGQQKHLLWETPTDAAQRTKKERTMSGAGVDNLQPSVFGLEPKGNDKKEGVKSTQRKIYQKESFRNRQTFFKDGLPREAFSYRGLPRETR